MRFDDHNSDTGRFAFIKVPRERRAKMLLKHMKLGVGFALCAAILGVGFALARADTDFGLMVEQLLNQFSATLFGIQQPLAESALGPFTGTDSTQAIAVATGLTVSIVSNATDPLADQIALWPDNVAFQPHTGGLVALEDGEVEVLNADGSLRELRGDDIWLCLPDGDDRDLLSDGCIRIASLRDTDSEPTGFIFDATGERAFVNLQHRSTGRGALLMISGFTINK
jgi:hypothetical protein